MLRFAILGALGPFLAGCAAHVTQITGPDGRPALVIACGSDRADCLKRAGEACPRGYAIVDDRQGVVATRRVMVADDTLTVTCN